MPSRVWGLDHLHKEAQDCKPLLKEGSSESLEYVPDLWDWRTKGVVPPVRVGKSKSAFKNP